MTCKEARKRQKQRAHASGARWRACRGSRAESHFTGLHACGSLKPDAHAENFPGREVRTGCQRLLEGCKSFGPSHPSGRDSDSPRHVPAADLCRHCGDGSSSTRKLSLQLMLPRGPSTAHSDFLEKKHHGSHRCLRRPPDSLAGPWWKPPQNCRRRCRQPLRDRPFQLLHQQAEIHEAGPGLAASWLVLCPPRWCWASGYLWSKQWWFPAWLLHL